MTKEQILLELAQREDADQLLPTTNPELIGPNEAAYLLKWSPIAHKLAPLLKDKIQQLEYPDIVDILSYSPVGDQLTPYLKHTIKPEHVTVITKLSPKGDKLNLILNELPHDNQKDIN
jgi:hypothetical protein